MEFRNVHQRWYESSSTLSMAISLLQNASREHRLHVVAHLKERMSELNPDVLVQAFEQRNGFWSFIQRRQTMDDYSWRMVETLRFVTEEQRLALATEMIYMIYCLENGQEYDSIPQQYSATMNLAM